MSCSYSFKEAASGPATKKLASLSSNFREQFVRTISFFYVAHFQSTVPSRSGSSQSLLLLTFCLNKHRASHVPSK